MKKSKKPISLLVATVLAATPLVAAPQVFAITSLSVDPDSNSADKETDYEITFELEEDLGSGEEITITFDEEFTINKSVTKNVKVDGKSPKNVEYNSKKNQIIIEVNKKYREGDDIKIVISDSITNPDSKGDYKVTVSAGDEDSDYKKVKIGSGSSSGSKNSSKNFKVDLDSTKADEKTTIELGDFDLSGSDKLKTGNVITVTFPEKGMLPKKISTSDVKVNGKNARDVSVDGSTVEIEVPSGANGNDYINLEFLKGAGIVTPSNGDHTFKIKYAGTTYTSEKFTIKGSGSSSSSTAASFSVSLSDPSPGSRTSYQFEVDFGNKQLLADEQILIEFPSSDMIPGILTASDFTLNGKTAKRVSALGNKVYITAPSNFSKDSTVKVNIAYDAWITSPKTAGTYNLKATVDNRTATSKDFTISGSSVNPAPVPTTPTSPTPTPTNPTAPTTVANNNTATIVLGTNTMGVATGLTVSVKSFGAPLAKQRDFIEMVFPAGYTVPAYIAPNLVSVNGVASNFVSVRGQNVLIYPSQDLPAGSAANVVISPSAKIINPKVKNAYSISVFTSAEKGLLFARSVGVGMPSPAQPAPAPTPTAPAPTAQQPAGVPANAALFKLGTNSFTLQGKTFPLKVAPYLANGNTTMVPAQFFKDGLNLTTQWNNYTVAVISGTNVVKFTVGSDKATVGNKTFTLTAPVVLKDGMPMVPVRFVTDNLGYKVGWDANTSSVYVYK